MRDTKSFTPWEQQKLKKIIFEMTGYRLRSNSLLAQIFTRSSYSHERGGENNEVLEFIGDQVLAYYLVKTVTARCGSRSPENEFASRIREDRFTAIKHELVSNETLCSIADKWDLARYLIVGRVDFDNAIDRQMKPRADLVEAMLGAIALESKWDPVVLETAVTQLLPIDEHLAQTMRRSKRPIRFKREAAVSALKEMADRGECPKPHYAFMAPETAGHDPWRCICTVEDGDSKITGYGEGETKKEAKQAASAEALDALGEKIPAGC